MWNFYKLCQGQEVVWAQTFCRKMIWSSNAWNFLSHSARNTWVGMHFFHAEYIVSSAWCIYYGRPFSNWFESVYLPREKTNILISNCFVFFPQNSFSAMKKRIILMLWLHRLTVLTNQFTIHCTAQRTHKFTFLGQKCWNNFALHGAIYCVRECSISFLLVDMHRIFLPCKWSNSHGMRYASVVEACFWTIKW